MGFIEHALVGLWAVLSNVWPFLLVLTPVIFIHELGHFLVARWCGVKVQTFSIGFGKEIFHFYDRYGTRWRFAWVPLGGYVKFMDDDNASSFPSREALDRMTPAEREGAFQTKPLAARAAIVAAGPIANFLLSIGIFTLLLTFLGEMVTPPRVGEVEAGSRAAAAGLKVDDTVVRINGEDIASFGEIDRMVALYGNRPLTVVVDRAGNPVELTVAPAASGAASDSAGKKTERPTIGILPPLMPARVGGVVSGSPAAHAGFEAGDLIVGIDGMPIKSFKDMQAIVKASAGRELAFEVERGGQTARLVATPEEREATDASGTKIKQGMIGIRAAPPEGQLRRYGPIEAFGQAVGKTYAIVNDSVTALYLIATRSMSADQLRGPLGIAEMSAQVASWGVVPLISFLAMISVAIGFFNLLPVPVLDGGHLMFYAIEAVRRQPLSERTQEISFRIGLALVLLLFIFVTIKDTTRPGGWFNSLFG